MALHAAKYVAHNDGVAASCEVERLYAEVIARRQELPTMAIPDTEGKISEQMSGAGIAPPGVCRRNQIDIRRRSVTIDLEAAAQCRAIVKTSVEDDRSAIVDQQRTMRALGTVSSTQRRVRKTDRAVRPERTSRIEGRQV